MHAQCASHNNLHLWPLITLNSGIHTALQLVGLTTEKLLPTALYIVIIIQLLLNYCHIYVATTTEVNWAPFTTHIILIINTRLSTTKYLDLLCELPCKACHRRIRKRSDIHKQVHKYCSINLVCPILTDIALSCVCNNNMRRKIRSFIVSQLMEHSLSNNRYDSWALQHCSKLIDNFKWPNPIPVW